MSEQFIKLSKFLAFVLRHKPDSIGLSLDRQGWIAVDDLLKACTERGIGLSRYVLREIVAGDNKLRYSFSADGLRIRANQGHSVPVDLGYTPQKPPDSLFHGTATRNIESIRAHGLVKGKRHHVHLSSSPETAHTVGMRYGRPVVLHVRAGDMFINGHKFYVSTNGVWLTDHVPSRYIGFPTQV